MIFHAVAQKQRKTGTDSLLTFRLHLNLCLESYSHESFLSMNLEKKPISIGYMVSFFTGMLANVSLWLLQTMYQICYTGNKKQVQNNQCAFIYQRSLTYFFSSGGCALLILSVFSERRSTRSQSFRFTKPRKESVRRQPELHW